jgi:hypothetical protein
MRGHYDDVDTRRPMRSIYRRMEKLAACLVAREGDALDVARLVRGSGIVAAALSILLFSTTTADAAPLPYTG